MVVKLGEVVVLELNQNAPSANACSSNHCGAESATGNCGISTFNAAANSLTTISILPIARHGPKFNTGGIFNFLQTAFKFSPANSSAPGDINPTFSSPPVEHPADNTKISFLINSFTNSTV